ncbi:MAG: DEAD/DEAH box helicase family protein [Planctomycetes bacterium]|nr:DEAD/DEAH box helicase family protein [Planctomycetota bacterium]
MERDFASRSRAVTGPPQRPRDVGQPARRLEEFIAVPQCRDCSLKLSASIYAAGINGALGRTPKVETKTVSFLKSRVSTAPWKSHRIKVNTFGFTFPEAIPVLPNKEESQSSSQPEASESILPPQAAVKNDHRQQKRKSTRLKPPDDALSLEDRLFYVLQPPLETWLAGQELIMPFEPFPYQYQGIAWLFSQKAALLADEMGLGKTMQAITAVRLLLRSHHIRRILLICPKPLIPNWQREFHMWAEEIPVVTIEGNSARRRMLWNMNTVPVLIANYELLVRDFEMFEEEEQPEFDLLILDEAQRIKNRDSRTAQTARSVGRKRSWALTGTPIENRLEEMASLFEFLEVIPPQGTPDLRQLSRLSQQYVLRRTINRVMTPAGINS